MSRLALLVAVLMAPVVAAQSLPSWAEPGHGGGTDGVGSEAHMMPPTIPGGGATPSQVPVDAGLVLLALAGGAYAVRRLRAR